MQQLQQRELSCECQRQCVHTLRGRDVHGVELERLPKLQRGVVQRGERVGVCGVRGGAVCGQQHGDGVQRMQQRELQSGRQCQCVYTLRGRDIHGVELEPLPALPSGIAERASFVGVCGVWSWVLCGQRGG